MDRARELGVPSVVVTFDPHPSEVVRPGSHPPLLAPHHRRAELMAELGVDALLILPFTTEFSKLSPGRVRRSRCWSTSCTPRLVVEGPNFRFGHKAAGDVELPRRAGPDVRLRRRGRRPVRERRRRAAASRSPPPSPGGWSPRATSRAPREILGRPHRVEGVVVRGAQRGRELGFPTANVETLPHTAIPADGVYAGWLHVEGEAMPAAISVGTNPQFDGTERTVEAYAIDRVGLDLYGLHVAVDFLAYVRGMAKFDSIDALLERWPTT